MADKDNYSPAEIARIKRESKYQSEVDKRGYYNEADIARIKREDPKGRKRFADVEKESREAAARKRAVTKKRE